MLYLWMTLFAAAVVAADQLTKYLVVANIPLYTQVDAIPGLFHLTYVQNTGAAFSAMEGMRWLFVLIFLGFTLFIFWEFPKKRWPFTTLERWCLAAVYAGGLGNIIDRVRLGYVVDMIQVEFISFPVFNVADCFITCGSILLLVHLAFWNKSFWKDGKK
ncbi:MAG TPA: signal peptidase II [Candidatus Faecousia intestinigallinarum]|nr:signal peptidase II [Candidatus Faecousia intestinigallinarum]